MMNKITKGGCVMQELFHPTMNPAQLQAMSVLGLAHMGDCVFELLVRTSLCLSGMGKSEHLHRATVEHVSAPAQAVFLDAILPCLTEEELAMYRRGRNAHVHAIPKNATHGQYAKATGLEALLGSLYLSGRRDRIEELFAIGWEAQHAL